MTQQIQQRKTLAALQNVGLLYDAVDQAMNREPDLPGIVVHYGPAGWGKTKAATYVSNKTRAYFVRCQSTWSTSWLLKAILNEMCIEPKGTVAAMHQQVEQQLAMSRRPLIIDEADHLITKRAIEVIRDIQDVSGATIVLVGEEQMPNKLQKWERVHGRVLVWAPAQPATMDDAAQLAELYCPGIEVKQDLMVQIKESAGASLRRICVNLARVNKLAISSGLKGVGSADWGDRPFFTGQAPIRGV